MVAGILLRHFKTYGNLHFIPVLDTPDNRFSLYIGQNGVGKSSILEALNSFFNNGKWNKFKGGKRDECFVAPILLIEKSKANPMLTSALIAQFDFISNYFWNSTDLINANLKLQPFQDYFNYRDDLKRHFDKDLYYFILVGIRYDERNEAFFSTFNDDLIQGLEDNNINFDPSKFLSAIKNIYSYIYVPVESSVNDVLKLESDEMRELMSKDILSEIANVLDEKKFEKHSGSGKVSIVNFLNQSLGSFIEGVNVTIQKINSEYSFSVDSGLKRNLTSLDLRTKILEAYFSIRKLKRGNKEISELSSGEQRMALIDIAASFIEQPGGREKYIILAIDEPEASMHISNCFKQFKNLENLSRKTDTQVLITTHWYGSIPTIISGKLHHIENTNSPILSSFNFLNYYEERKAFPNDVLLKSFFELVTSIISNIKNENTNWLICEGSDDKRYLERYLDKVSNLIVLPVGGIGNVIKLYQFLYIPFSEKTENQLINGRVLCLIDSDEDQITLDLPNIVNSKLRIGRLQIERDFSFKLRTLNNNGFYKKTSMEDCLNPELLFLAINYTIKQYYPDYIEKMTHFAFDETKINSRIDTDDSILKAIDFEGTQYKSEILSLIKSNKFKYRLAEKYVEISHEIGHTTPTLFNLIESYYRVTSESNPIIVSEELEGY
jgi:ABC-type Mn2+/Zn2+ transport system ATPase subunit